MCGIPEAYGVFPYDWPNPAKEMVIEPGYIRIRILIPPSSSWRRVLYLRKAIKMLLSGYNGRDRNKLNLRNEYARRRIMINRIDAGGR